MSDHPPDETDEKQDPSASTSGAPGDALERLAKLRESEPETSRQTPYWLGVVVLVGIAVFLGVFPALLEGGSGDAERLEAALAYCKYREDQTECEGRIRVRDDYCAERHDQANEPDHVDVYGRCMAQEFEDFYLIAGWNRR